MAERRASCLGGRAGAPAARRAPSTHPPTNQPRTNERTNERTSRPAVSHRNAHKQGTRVRNAATHPAVHTHTRYARAKRSRAPCSAVSHPHAAGVKRNGAATRGWKESKGSSTKKEENNAMQDRAAGVARCQHHSFGKGLWIFFELLAYRGVMKMSRRQYRHAHPRLDMLEVRLHSPLLWNSKNTLLLSHEARHESRNTRDLHTHHQHHSEHTTTHMPPPAPPTPSYSRLKYAGCGWIFVWRRTALSTHMCERVDKPRMRGVYPTLCPLPANTAICLKYGYML